MINRPEKSSPSVVALLRERTESAHRRLEASDFVLPATLDRTRYAALIGAMLGFHIAIEGEFSRFVNEFAARGLAMDGRYKAHLLREESTRLGSPPVKPPALSFASALHAAGAVYVMEGSTLGGMHIARSIETHLQFSSGYYGCYGVQTASRWREMRCALEAFPRNGMDREAMCAGAEITFDALYEHLEHARLG